MHETDKCHGGCPGQRVKIPEILTQNPGNVLKNYGMDDGLSRGKALYSSNHPNYHKAYGLYYFWCTWKVLIF